jgi:enoyl-[acyl-carrier protein] reductase I
MSHELEGRWVLITGIVDDASLAVVVARRLQDAGARLVCTGLGLTPHHQVGDRARRYLEDTYASFERTVSSRSSAGTLCLPLDVTLDRSLDDLGSALSAREIQLAGVLHAVAMDRTIRAGRMTPLLEVSRDEFLSCLDVSAYSLIALARTLTGRGLLAAGASIVSLSYLGAERAVPHPYKNIGVAKAALERITRELAIEGLAGMVRHADAVSPLGNARPSDLAAEVLHLMSPDLRVTGAIRDVDGGWQVTA